MPNFIFYTTHYEQEFEIDTVVEITCVFDAPNVQMAFLVLLDSHSHYQGVGFSYEEFDLDANTFAQMMTIAQPYMYLYLGRVSITLRTYALNDKMAFNDDECHTLLPTLCALGVPMHKIVCTPDKMASGLTVCTYWLLKENANHEE